MRPRRLFLAMIAAMPAVAAAGPFYLSPDVPSDLGGTTCLPWHIVRDDAGGYAPAVSLPFGAAIDGLHRMSGGDWLFSLEAAMDLGGTTYDRRDLIRFDGTTYSLYWSGAAAGVPAGANVGDFFLLGPGDGALILGFGAPATILGTTYVASDLVQWTAGGGFSLYLDSAAAGVPSASRVTAAARHGAATLLSFDTPTTIAGATYLPGDLVSWDGGALALFHRDPAWPSSSRVNALACPFWYRDLDGDGQGALADQVTACSPLAGYVGNGNDCNDADGTAWAVPGEATSLMVAGGSTTLSWSAPASPGGSIEYYDLLRSNRASDFVTSALCIETNGTDTEAADAQAPPVGAGFYYLVRAGNSCAEGTLGTNSSGVPHSARACP